MLKDVLELFNTNDIAYQLIRKPEFGKSYIKAQILDSGRNNEFLSLFQLQYKKDNAGFYNVGDDVYVSFATPEIEDAFPITYAERFLMECSDYVQSAECISGNVNAMLSCDNNCLPEDIQKMISHSQKLVKDKYIVYSIKKDDSKLVLTVRRNRS
jgi:mRNA-degrading endonuclease HigB of HigAB toxin-antitoxin module